MSGETEREPSGWTVDQLKQHYDKLLSEMDKRYTERFVSQEKAIDKKHAEIEVRFQGVNEFRQVLTDQSATFITRTEALSAIRAVDEKSSTGVHAVDDKVDLVREQVKVNTARGAGINAAWGYLIGAVGVASAVIGIIIATR